MSAHGCALENSFAPIGALNLRHSFAFGAVMSIKERADADERSFKLVRTPEAILFSWMDAVYEKCLLLQPSTALHGASMNIDSPHVISSS